MRGTIIPEYRFDSTINHPTRPEEVIGFRGRNTKLGISAIILKESAIEGETIIVPEKAGQSIIDAEEDTELAVLNEDIVLTMPGRRFEGSHQEVELEGRGEIVQAKSIPLHAKSWIIFDRHSVEVGN